jgi:hypothetical protein
MIAGTRLSRTRRYRERKKNGSQHAASRLVEATGVIAVVAVLPEQLPFLA